MQTQKLALLRSNKIGYLMTLQSNNISIFKRMCARKKEIERSAFLTSITRPNCTIESHEQSKEHTLFCCAYHKPYTVSCLLCKLSVSRCRSRSGLFEFRILEAKLFDWGALLLCDFTSNGIILSLCYRYIAFACGCAYMHVHCAMCTHFCVAIQKTLFNWMRALTSYNATKLIKLLTFAG